MDSNDQKVEITNEDITEEDFSEEKLNSEDTDWKAEAMELKGLNKRRATQLRKAKENMAKPPTPEPKAPEKKETTDNTELLEKLKRVTLRSLSITNEDEVGLVDKWEKETGREVESFAESNIFKAELEELRTNKANALATSDIKGSQATAGAKNEPAYWLAKGVPPTREEVPDFKARAKIGRAFISFEKKDKITFYNSPK